MSIFAHSFEGDDGGILVLRLPDALNHLTAEELEREIRRLLPNRDDAGLVLDCADVRLITSIGVASLLQAHDICDRFGAPMVLAALSDELADMLSLLKLHGRFKSEPDRERAIATAQSMPRRPRR